MRARVPPHPPTTGIGEEGRGFRHRGSPRSDGPEWPRMVIPFHPSRPTGDGAHRGRRG